MFYLIRMENFSFSECSASYVAQAGEAVIEQDHFPTDAEADAALPGFLLARTKLLKLQELEFAHADASNEDFTSDATGTMLTWYGKEESEETLTRNTVGSILHLAESGWTTRYTAVDTATGTRTLVTLTVPQVQAVFTACCEKHAAIDAHYLAKVDAVNAITDISSVGVAAMDAIVW